MPKRKVVRPNTTERDWLRRNIPTRTLTRWKKRKINRALSDSGEHTAQHESDEDDTQREEQRAGPLTVPQQESEDTTQRDELREEPLTLPQESDEDDSQREEERAEPLTVPQENNEGGSQRQEQRAESFTMVQDNVPQEVDDVHSSHGLTEEQSIISILSFRLRHNTTGVR
ncbi:unnamed protein product [Pleuronectes platessa]|uniref:Uncharacterized protein n=1 Tax=Pleuronectes platessa TaxID=8262 RepID=A0A9N7UN05_PLEPL|nr:unnamed protein product [Pleuronectes platessa]